MVTYLELLEMEEKGTQPERVFYNDSVYRWDNGYFRKGREHEPYESYSLLGDVSREFDPIELITKNIIEIIDWQKKKDIV